MSNQITRGDLDRGLSNLMELAQKQNLIKEHHSINIEQYEEKLNLISKDIQRYHECRQVFLDAAQLSREKTVSVVEKTVTNALRAVMSDPTAEFKVEMKERRSNLEADFLVEFETENGRVRDDPLDAKGGSVVDIVTSALLVSLLSIYPPYKRQTLWMDEPGKWLDRSRRKRFSHWLDKVSKDLGIQLVIITHDEELVEIGDKIFELAPGKKGVEVHISEALKAKEGYEFI